MPTAAESLILAARDLATAAGHAIPLEDLVIRAWRRDPARFGLRGHADTYPDAKRVSVTISDHTGLLAKGWVRRAGPNRLAITEAGFAAARRLTAPPAGVYDAEPAGVR